MTRSGVVYYFCVEDNIMFVWLAQPRWWGYYSSVA